MKIRFEVKQNVAQEDIDKYQLKMFRKRRKGIEFSVGEEVRLVKENNKFVPKNKQWAVDYYSPIEFGEGIPEILVITGVSKTEVRFKSYWYSKQLIEKYENKLPDFT